MKKIAASVVIGFAVVMAATLVLTSCGAEWAACETCRLGEEAAVADDGKQIPVVVNVDIDVNVNQTQTQTDATPVCRRICVAWEKRFKCDRGWHNSDHKGRCLIDYRMHNRCTKEVTQCW